MPSIRTFSPTAIAHSNGWRPCRTGGSQRIEHEPTYTVADFAPRITFLKTSGSWRWIFHDFTFHHSRDVNDFYDFIEDRIRETDRKWYFLVNYNDCRIEPAAWVQYASRGKRLNIAASLGSVRFATGSETEADIRCAPKARASAPTSATPAPRPWRGSTR